ncbi:MAG: hypothetical protein HOL16_02385 [Alphaproteobacteria bacterium]|nr:hypothetical protein [Alphaproteobacteria bacterium]
MPIWVHAAPSSGPYTDTKSFESEAFRLKTQLQNHLTSMKFETPESGIERLKDVRSARTELLELQADQSLWEALYTKLQVLKMPETEDLLLWPNQTYEMACKGNLLAKAVFRNDALFSDLESIVANRFSNVEYVEQIFSNLFWWNPLLLERMHLETLLVAGSSNMKKDSIDRIPSPAVYGNSLAMWTFLKGMMNNEKPKRELFSILSKKRVCVLANLSTHMPEDGSKGTLSQTFEFLENANYREEQEKLLRSKTKEELGQSLSRGERHAGVFLGRKLTEKATGVESIPHDVYLASINSSVADGKLGQPDGWYRAYSLFKFALDRKIIYSDEEDEKWYRLCYRMTFLLKGKTTRIENYVIRESMFVDAGIAPLVKTKYGEEFDY